MTPNPDNPVLVPHPLDDRMVAVSEPVIHSRDCEECDGHGFVVLYDYDGPGLHDETNCECFDPSKACAHCRKATTWEHPPEAAP